MGDTVVLTPQQSQTGLLAPNSVVYDVRFQVVLAQVLTCIMHDRTTTLPGHHTEFSTNNVGGNSVKHESFDQNCCNLVCVRVCVCAADTGW